MPQLRRSAGDPELVVRLRAAGCVFAEDEAVLLIEAAAGDPALLESLTSRRVAGQPLEQILGWASFCGLRIVVEPGVFVPRRRTEYLARRTIALTVPGALVVELCCGSGAISAALLAAVPGARVHAGDLDQVHVRCAATNLGDRVALYQGDLYQPLPPELRGLVQVLVANAPYVPTDQIRAMPPEARDYEPLIALDGGPDGLDILRRVIGEAPEWLAPGGHLLFECAAIQAVTVVDVCRRAGLKAKVRTSAMAGATVVVGSRDESSTAGDTRWRPR